MLGIGIAIGWLAKPAPDTTPVAAVSEPSKTNSISKPASPAEPPAESSTPRKRVSREPSVKKPSAALTGEEMEQAKKMQQGVAKAMIDRQRAKYEQHIQRLADSLGLTADQKSKLGTWLDGQMKKYEGMDFSNPESMSGVGDLAKSLSTQAIEEQLAPLLTEDQKSSLTTFKEKDRQTKVDSMALKNLSHLQGIIEFEDGQRDEIYKVLSAAAEERLLKQQEKPDPTAIFTEGMGIEMDPYDLGLQQAFGEIAGDLAKSGEASDQKQVAKSMREIIDQRIEAKVEQLRPVLNDKQLEQYRTELKTKGAGVFGNAIMGLEDGDGTSSSTIVIPAN